MFVPYCNFYLSFDPKIVLAINEWAFFPENIKVVEIVKTELFHFE